MKTVGIIAEYNPFHRGHEYQIRQIRKQTGAEHVIIVMSGDFVQRGTPAWTDKFLRTEMALAGGADLVFELPVHFSTASAEGFAQGGVSLLDSLGFVDGICFGSECGNLEALSQIAHFLVAQDARIHTKIQNRLAEGCTYPAARAEILSDAFPNLLRQIPGIFTDPNNILAIEYLKALYRLDSPMTPVTITRQGAGYHERTPEQAFPSSTAIRSYYAQTGCLPEQGIPETIQALLQKYPDRFPMTEDDLSDMLYYKLRTMDDAALSICDMTPELWKRMQHQLPHYHTPSQFVDLIKTKGYTQTRIQRVLLHLLLDLYPTTPSACYARLLGFRQKHSDLLRTQTNIPVLTKVADAATQLTTAPAKEQWQADLRAHDLYRYLLLQKHPNARLADDYHAGLSILPA